MGNIDLDVVKSASSWSEGIKSYQRQKHAPLHEVTPKPDLVTTYMKSREDAAINPILQKFTDPSSEERLKTIETSVLSRNLNNAWDKQLLREQHFDVINQGPKRGHIHEVPYVQKLKPPSLITATRSGGFDIISTLGHDQHHWAPPGKRPARIVTPPRKEPFLTAVNKPREYDILSNRFRDDHESRSTWEAERGRAETVAKYWESRDFDPVSCSYYDTEKEGFYQKRIKELLLTQGRDQISKLPPTLAASESLMYNICTGVVRDHARLEKKIEAERAALEARASKVKAEEMMRVRGDIRHNRSMERKDARISHSRYTDVLERGFNIINNQQFDKVGEPPMPHTKPKPTMWEYKNSLRAAAESGGSNRAQTTPSVGEKTSTGVASQRSGPAGAIGEHKSGPVSRGTIPTSLSKVRVRSAGFQNEQT